MMRSSASAAAAPMWKASAASAPAANPANTAFSSRKLSLATEKSTMVSTLVAALSAVLKKKVSLPALPVNVSLPSSAVDLVVAGVAGDEIVDFVAGQVDGGRRGGIDGPQRLGRNAGASV